MASSVKVPRFGDVTVGDGAAAVMDGGIHGVQGHTIVVDATGESRWERRLDGMRPSGRAGSGRVQLEPDELARVRASADQLWQLASSGRAKFDPPIEHGPPRWVWAIVLRRGNETRVLTGSGIASPDGAPEPAQKVLAWLVTRVDALANQP